MNQTTKHTIAGLVPVTSSNLAAVGYDARRQALEIQFHGGGRYRYAGVPRDRFLALCQAKSKGGYFHRCIRDQFACTRVA